MKIITHEHAPALDWPAAIEALRRGHRLPRPEQQDVLLGDADYRLLARAARIDGLGVAVKAETIVPRNAAQGRRSIQGQVTLYDAHHGGVRALIESRLVTEYKTASDSVLGALCLARPDSRHLVIMGAGAMADTFARAYDAAFPGLERVSIWARRPEQARALAGTLQHLRCTVAATDDIAAALQTADIVSTITNATDPILHAKWVRPGTHVDLVGSFTPQMCEADADLVEAAQVHVDYHGTTVGQVGELLSLRGSQEAMRAHVAGDLYDLCTLQGSPRHDAQAITLFKNGGGAHLDLMIADYIARQVEATSQP